MSFERIALFFESDRRRKATTMLLSRRSFVRTLGLGAASAKAAQWHLAGVVSAAIFEPRRTGLPGGPIRLNSNENAYGPSAKVATTISAATSAANRYPFIEADELVDRIAAFHGLKREQVLLGCGSTEILRVAATAFLGPGKQLIQASPTFEAMAHYAKSAGGEFISVPLNARYAHDLDAMLARAGSTTTLVCICNPNNPTASITPRQDIETFISKLPVNCYVLIDEAYHHFAGVSSMYASFIDRPLHDERVIVARTFSKVYGLAGLRIGYAVAAPAVIDRLRSRVTLDNVNGIAAQAAAAALQDDAGVRDFVKRNADDRQEFFNQAMARMLKPIDSHANFVMMDTHHPAEEVIEHFRRNKIEIGRRFPAMNTHIRVSLGTPEEMQAFWRAWDLLPFAKTLMHH
jgi:histidinol-phosphate aminotransferase